jgi:Uncharacterized phage-associated protein
VIHFTKTIGGKGVMTKRTVFDVADWFLGKDSMSPKKLQKIVYYAYAWVLTLMNESENDLDIKLFDSRIEAWVHGPVIPELYHKYKKHGGDIIPQKSDVPEFETDIKDVLEQVWDVYGKYTGNQLESITHQESPWIKAREGCSPVEICTNEIKDSDIFKCYIERVS